MKEPVATGPCEHKAALRLLSGYQIGTTPRELTGGPVPYLRQQDSAHAGRTTKKPASVYANRLVHLSLLRSGRRDLDLNPRRPPWQDNRARFYALLSDTNR
jgi:hypothetical protein